MIVHVNRGCYTVCNSSEPAKGLESKFSLRMTTAFALAGIDTAAIANYNETHCADPKLVALRDKTTVELDSNIGRMATEITDEMIRAALATEYPEDDGLVSQDIGFGMMRKILENALAAAPTEIMEVFIQVILYGGYFTTRTAMRIARSVFTEQGLTA